MIAENISVDAALEKQMADAKRKARADARCSRLPAYYCERHQRRCGGHFDRDRRPLGKHAPVGPDRRKIKIHLTENFVA